MIRAATDRCVGLLLPADPGAPADPFLAAATDGSGVRLVDARTPEPFGADVVAGWRHHLTEVRRGLAAGRAQGWDTDLRAHHRRGGRILGICGGFQMLGRSIADPQGLEGEPGVTEGLGYLDVETVLAPDKRLTRVTAVHAPSGLQVAGYEIHLGRTDGPDCVRPFAHVGDLPEGARSSDRRVEGTYLHGLFTSDDFRTAWIQELGATTGAFSYAAEIEAVLDELAAHIEAHLDVQELLRLAR